MVHEYSDQENHYISNVRQRGDSKITNFYVNYNIGSTLITTLTITIYHYNK